MNKIILQTPYWKYAILIGISLPLQIFADSIYTIDKEHTNVGFEVDHLVISTINGRFTEFDGTIILDSQKKKLQSIEGFVLSKSIDTDNDKRDQHLKSPDFFDSKKFPKLLFSISGLDLQSGDSESVKGSLTIHGITKEIKLKLKFKGTVSDPWGIEKVAVEAETEINRKDFGLTWNENLETGGVMVGENVKLIVRAQGNLKEDKVKNKK